MTQPQAVETGAAAGQCTEPFEVEVPLAVTRKGKQKKGVAVLRVKATGVATGGKQGAKPPRDSDRLKLIFLPSAQ